MLILDGFAMRQLSAAQADEPYELVSERQGRSLTSANNRASSDWCPVFANPVAAEALLDRLNQHQASSDHVRSQLPAERTLQESHRPAWHPIK